MIKKLLILFIIIFPMALVSQGCSPRTKDSNKAISFLKSLNSYTCDVNIHTQNTKQQIDKDGKQFYDNQFGHRLDLSKERVLIYNNSNIKVKDLNNNILYTIDRDFDSVYNLSFIHEYIALLYTDEEITSSFKTIENREYQLVKLSIPGNNRNIKKAVLYINLENYYPEKIVIYDYKDNEIVNFLYSNFQPNPKIPKEMFYLE